MTRKRPRWRNRWDSTYTLYSDSVKSAYFADTELEGEELDAAVEAKMAELAYPTREELVESETNAKVLEKVRDEAVKDVTVSEKSCRRPTTPMWRAP